MKKINTGFVILLISSFFLVAAQAQVRELRGASQGRGNLTQGGQRDQSLREASIFLKRNGDAEISLLGDEEFTFTARWVSGRTNNYELVLTGGFGNAGASGKGKANIKPNGQIVSLELNGYARRRPFSVTFDGDDLNNNNPQGDPSSEYIGVYRSTERTQNNNQDFNIVRVLRIKDDGTAELVSRFKGGVPVVNRDNLRLHGDLLPEIRDSKTVLHTGTWRRSGRGIEVLLRTVNGSQTVQATFKFELRGNEPDNLQTVTWDRGVYGSSGFQFGRAINEESDPQQEPPVEEQINLSDEGDGSLSIGRDPRRNINRVSVIRSANNNLEISLHQSNGNTIRFGGEVSNIDTRLITVRLTNSGNASASGTITIETQANNRIKRLTGNGRLDSRNFTVEFNGGNAPGYDPDTNDRDRINLSQRGSGLWKREGRSNANIENVEVTSIGNREVEVSLRLSNGQSVVLGGTIESRNAYRLVIRLTNSANANASGTVNVEYGANQSINTLSGDGRLDGNRFSIQFSKR
jgi:hypothetical protein